MRERAPWRKLLYRVIFESDTPAGKTFDVILLWTILASVLVVMLDSVAAIRQVYGFHLYVLEWFFTVLFTIEYMLRLLSVGRPARYAKSFFGLVDLLAVVPTYLGLLLPGGRYLLVIRILRLIRVFRVFKLVEYLSQGEVILEALRRALPKITVFLVAVISLVVIFGSLMYVIEGEANGFTSIPMSIYWAIVTLTTVGYGDISPLTPVGRGVAAMVMILGYGIIAVPTGIVTVELSRTPVRRIRTRACEGCGREGHDTDARFCKHCGSNLSDARDVPVPERSPR
jgi:voltage-gated potassium channel